LGWTLEYTLSARKSLRKLSVRVADRITLSLAEIAALDDPRLRGHALVGKLRGLWRYRVEDWRIIVRLEDQRMVVLVLAIGHRREVYD
jgi:mRNA interferase RelE/StbE